MKCSTRDRDAKGTENLSKNTKERDQVKTSVYKERRHVYLGRTWVNRFWEHEVNMQSSQFSSVAIL